MKLEQQVVSLELSKQLKELGVKQESLWYWFEIYGRQWKKSVEYEIHTKNDVDKYRRFITTPLDNLSIYSAFTVAELGEMLPTVIKTGYYLRITKDGKWWRCYYKDLLYGKGELVSQEANTEANARAKMVIYLKEKED